MSKKVVFSISAVKGEICTAETVAAIRGCFAHDPTHPLAKVLFDPYAPLFCGFPLSLVFFFPPVTIPLFRWSLRKLINCSSPMFVRAYVAEKWLADYVEKKDMRQFVLVAAGYDSFCARRKDLLAKLQVFEVDLAAMQKKKAAVMDKLFSGSELAKHMHYVPADLSKISLSEALKTSVFEAEQPAFFSMLGVSYYLAEEVFYETMKNFANSFAKGSVIAIDYMFPDECLDEERKEYKKAVMDFVASLGEPMIFESTPEELVSRCEKLGLKVVENRTIDDIGEELGLGNDSSSQACCYGVVVFEKS